MNSMKDHKGHTGNQKEQFYYEQALEPSSKESRANKLKEPSSSVNFMKNQSDVDVWPSKE